ncbi:MAG: hypothetical protein R6V27_06415 [Balneolaceae bacterium]
MNRSIIITRLQLLFRFILGLLLLIAGVLKVQDNTALLETVAYITWIPTWVQSFGIDFLPWIEVTVGGLMMSGLFKKVVLPAGALIYAGFFVFAIYGLGSGLEGDCGCFGDVDDSNLLAMVLGSTFGWSMIVRNGIFVAMAGFLFITTSSRTETENAKST